MDCSAAVGGSDDDGDDDNDDDDDGNDDGSIFCILNAVWCAHLTIGTNKTRAAYGVRSCRDLYYFHAAQFCPMHVDICACLYRCICSIDNSMVCNGIDIVSCCSTFVQVATYLASVDNFLGKLIKRPSSVRLLRLLRDGYAAS
ncbi:unnamed protein product [Cercopithifilaria johnstoni]|uniref:Uncharacterized protein n=1 Tax=Cercopithifilaria johnstoni TaxID=2874296 RepID=A0A8J2QB33_9BILA|nr:unnamed protein product [Cercopithifilaria johnstoni]